jgi:NADPH-dependent glutamate synthase beta subunit-like oxidoreductase/NAD-dependent dihydropyrimidine dehydrogenase PreA subunit
MSGTRVASDAKEIRVRAAQVEKLPPCQAHCPNSGDVRGWLGIIAQREKNGLSLDDAYDKAWEMIAERNPIPASLARICPHPCEDLCTRAEKDGAVSINAMERFLGDWAISRSLPLPGIESESRPESIGVVGSGPAGLSFAYQMARRGYGVTMYEQSDSAGGMLRHAIPDFRLPREILDAELERLLNLNISLLRNADVGNTISLEKLRDRHALVFLGLGAQAGRMLGIPGETGPGVLSGIEYLRRRKRQPDAMEGKQVLVVGGGNTAIDAARSARRDGAAVTVVYRRSEVEMPAAAAEVTDARAEGVEFRFLLAPLRIVREREAVRSVEVQEMQLGDPDKQGRRRPEPIAGQLHDISADVVIVAVAQAPDWQGMGSITTAEQWLTAEQDGKLGEGVFAGGDDRGPGIASTAVAQGRLAAESAHAQLSGQPLPDRRARPRALERGSVRTDFYPNRSRTSEPRKAQEEWLNDPESEIDLTMDYEQACEEAARCMSCGLCFDCQQCFMYCNGAGFTRVEETSPGNYFALALDACEGCGKCIELCPCGFIEERANPPVA